MPGNREPIFKRRSVNGQEVEEVPTILYIRETIPPLETRSIILGPKPGRYPAPLFGVPESGILGRILGVDAIRSLVLDSLGISSGDRTWFLVETQRRLLLPSAPHDKPGDFDLIVGRVRDGLVNFDQLSEVEFKVRRTNASGKPRGAEMGIDQGRGAAACGFDRSLLIHLLVKDPEGGAEGTGGWYELALNAHGSRRALEGNVELMRRQCQDDEPFGYLAIAIGQGPGGDPSMSGALQYAGVWTAPERPHRGNDAVSSRRAEMSANLRSLVGDRRPGSPFLRICPCGSVVGGEEADIGCPTCGGSRP